MKIMLQFGTDCVYAELEFAFGFISSCRMCHPCNYSFLQSSIKQFIWIVCYVIQKVLEIWRKLVCKHRKIESQKDVFNLKADC